MIYLLIFTCLAEVFVQHSDHSPGIRPDPEFVRLLMPAYLSKVAFAGGSTSAAWLL